MFKKNKNMKIFSILVLAGVVLIIWGNTTDVLGITIKTPAPIDPYAEILQNYQTQISNDKISNEEKAMLQQKYEPLVIEATKRASILSQNSNLPTVKKTPFSTPTQGVEISIAEGINNQPIIPRYSSEYLFLNSWSKTIDGLTYLVYAGAMVNDSEQGLVYIQDPKNYQFAKILSPQKSGAIQIVSEKNLVLTLISEKGNLFFFDVINKIFINDSDKPLTATAYP